MNILHVSTGTKSLPVTTTGILVIGKALAFEAASAPLRWPEMGRIEADNQTKRFMRLARPLRQNLQLPLPLKTS